MQFLKFCRPLRTDNELLATVSWVVWDELRLAPVWRRGSWSPSLGRGCLLKKKEKRENPLIASDYSLSLLFSPLYYFHHDFKVSSRGLFLYFPDPLKIITETIAAHAKAFRDTAWTREQAKPQRQSSFPSKEEWILRVSFGVCANGCFTLQLLCVQMPSIHCPASPISAFWGVESDSHLLL